MKIAVYIRVSTKEQREDIQLDDIQKYCEFKNYQNVTYFKDLGESGAKHSRPQLDLMLDQIRKGHFDAVLCWKFDRIGRSTVHLISIMQELKSLNVDFISIKENIDTTSSMGKMIFGIFAVLAEFERDTIRQRTKAGIDLAKSNGVHCGRPETYCQKTREEIFSMFNNGMKPDKIAKKMKMHRATVYRIIKKMKE